MNRFYLILLLNQKTANNSLDKINSMFEVCIFSVLSKSKEKNQHTNLLVVLFSGAKK